MPKWAAIAVSIFLSTFRISSAFTSQMTAFSLGLTLGLTLGWVVHLLFAASVYHLVRSTEQLDVDDIAAGFIAGIIALTAFTVVYFAWVPAASFGPGVGFAQSSVIDLGSSIPGFISSRLFGAGCGALLALMTGIVWQHDIVRKANTRYLMLSLALGLVI